MAGRWEFCRAAAHLKPQSGKTLLFCGSGNVLLKYGTRDLNVVCGMLKIMPFTAVLFGGGALALAGMPPFNIFLANL